MFRIIMGLFLIAHGLVHLLYLGQSRKLFELSSGMVWPDESWAFSSLLDQDAARRLASGFCLLAALGFALGGLASLFQAGWWRVVVIAAAAFSILLYVLFWDGTMHKLHDQGLIGTLISLAVIGVVLRM